MSIIICRAPEVAMYRSVLRCPICEKNRRHVITEQGWYGELIECCGCANSWPSDGGGEPYAPPWKGMRGKQRSDSQSKEIGRVKEKWASVTMTKKEAWRANYEYCCPESEIA